MLRVPNFLVMLFLAPVTAIAAQGLDTLKEKASYSFGVDFAKRLKQQGIDLDTSALIRGIQDQASGRKLAFKEGEMNQFKAEYRQQLRVKLMQAQRALTASNTFLLQESGQNTQKGITIFASSTHRISFKQPPELLLVSPSEIRKLTLGNLKPSKNVLAALYNTDNPLINIVFQVPQIKEIPAQLGNNDIIKLRRVYDLQFSSLPGFSKISDNTTTVAGLNAFEYTFNSRAQDTLLRQKQMLIIFNGKALILTLCAPENLFDDIYQRWFSNLLDNLKIERKD